MGTPKIADKPAKARKRQGSLLLLQIAEGAWPSLISHDQTSSLQKYERINLYHSKMPVYGTLLW